jgi:hypothetical protein
MIATIKGPTGWTAPTYINYGGGAELHIVTHKSLSGIISTFVEILPTRFVMESGIVRYAARSDFRKTYMTSTGKCTEKKVAMQQYEGLQRLDEIKADCAAFYAATMQSIEKDVV